MGRLDGKVAIVTGGGRCVASPVSQYICHHHIEQTLTRRSVGLRAGSAAMRGRCL